MAAFAVALIAAPAAWAHAQLDSTTPADGAVVQTSPQRVVLRFSEAVETALGSVRVLDGDGKRVDTGTTVRPAPDTVSVALEPRLADGTYTVSWRVVSADSHPVHGAFTFSVGAPGAAAVVTDGGTAKGVSVAFTAVRFLAFALILLLAGGAVASTTVFGDAPRALWRALAGLAALLVPVTFAGILLQGASAGGFSVGEALRPEVLRAVVGTRFGQVWVAQGGAGLALAGLALAHRRHWPREAFALLAVLLVLAPPSAGHAHVAGAWTFVADAAHVLAAAVWTGGLALTAAALALAGEARWELAQRAVPRFSALAVGAVAALLVAGIANAYLEVRAWRGLVDTTYGNLLLAKIGLVVILVGLGAYNNRRAVPRLRAGLASLRERRRFVRTACAELGIVVAVVAVTSVLVAEPPARDTVAPAGPFSAEVRTDSLVIDLVVDPARAGANAVHVYLLDPSGGQAEAEAVTVSARLESPPVGPLELAGVRAGPGHFVVPGAQLPLAGTWRLRVEARTGELAAQFADFAVPIGKD